MIEIIDVHKSFDGKKVLEGVNLSIEDGETIVIIGRSGCGKTVLLKSIIGLIRPDSGSIIVDGQDITKIETAALFEMRKQFGMLFQGAALFDSMTVDENIGLSLREHMRLNLDEIQERIREKLEVVGLPGIEKKKPAELSGGMKKRVGLARALIMDPKYVLFDEPTTGLDPVMADAIDLLICETNRRLHITSIVVTHDMASTFKIADRIAMLSDGHIVFDGTPDEARKSRVELLRQFVDGRSDLS